MHSKLIELQRKGNIVLADSTMYLSPNGDHLVMNDSVLGLTGVEIHFEAPFGNVFGFFVIGIEIESKLFELKNTTNEQTAIEAAAVAWTKERLSLAWEKNFFFPA